MRRLNIILLLFAVTFISCNDNVDDNVVVSYWDNGNVKSELRYSDGKLDGLCKWYYYTGRAEMEANFTMNVLNDTATRWHENGSLYEKCNYKDN